MKPRNKVDMIAMWLAFIVVGVAFILLLNMNPTSDQWLVLGSVAVGISVNWLLNRLAINHTKQKRKRG